MSNAAGNQPTPNQLEITGAGEPKDDLSDDSLQLNSDSDINAMDRNHRRARVRKGPGRPESDGTPTKSSDGGSSSGSDDSVLGFPKMKSSGEAALSHHLLAVMEQRRKRQEQESKIDANSSDEDDMVDKEDMKQFAQKKVRRSRGKSLKTREQLSWKQPVEGSKQVQRQKLSKADNRKRKLVKPGRLPPLWEEAAGKNSPLQTDRLMRKERTESHLKLEVDSGDQYRTFTLSPSEEVPGNQLSSPPTPANLPEVITLDAPLSHLPILCK